MTGDVIEIKLGGREWRQAEGRKWQGRAYFRFRPDKASPEEVTETETQKIRRTSHAKLSGEKGTKGYVHWGAVSGNCTNLQNRLYIENSLCSKKGKASHQLHDGG